MLAFPCYTLEVSVQYDHQFAAERTKATSGNTGNLLVAFVVLVPVVWICRFFYVCSQC